jgi:hypothetical protein
VPSLVLSRPITSSRAPSAPASAVGICRTKCAAPAPAGDAVRLTRVIQPSDERVRYRTRHHRVGGQWRVERCRTWTAGHLESALHRAPRSRGGALSVKGTDTRCLDRSPQSGCLSALVRRSPTIRAWATLTSPTRTTIACIMRGHRIVRLPHARRQLRTLRHSIRCVETAPPLLPRNGVTAR